MIVRPLIMQLPGAHPPYSQSVDDLSQATTYTLFILWMTFQFVSCLWCGFCPLETDKTAT